MRLQQLVGREHVDSATTSPESAPSTTWLALPWSPLLPALTGFVGAASGALIAVLIARAVVPARGSPEAQLASLRVESVPSAGSSSASAMSELGEPAPAESPAKNAAPDSRSLEQALEGMWRRQDQRREELVALTRELERSQPRSQSQLRRLRALADDPLLLPDVLTAMARLSGPESADLVHDVWMSSRDREEVARAAEALVYSTEVRAKASPALRVALELGKARRCEDSFRLLKEAKKHGDRRALKALVALTRRAPGCPENRFGDCNACVRRGTDLRDAIAAARERRSPSFR